MCNSSGGCVFELIFFTLGLFTLEVPFHPNININVDVTLQLVSTKCLSYHPESTLGSIGFFCLTNPLLFFNFPHNTSLPFVLTLIPQKRTSCKVLPQMVLSKSARWWKEDPRPFLTALPLVVYNLKNISVIRYLIHLNIMFSDFINAEIV